MSTLSIITIFIGSLIIVVRAPMIVFPNRTIEVYKKLTATDSRIRSMGLAAICLAAGAVYLSYNSVYPAARIILFWGYIVGTLTLLFGIVYTSRYREFIVCFVEISENRTLLRFFSTGAVLFGCFFIYLGVEVFNEF